MIESSSEGTNLNSQQNETSNYASAETSPSPSLISSSSSQSLRSNTSLNGDDTQKSKLSQSISIASLLGNNLNKSLSKHPSMDDPSIVNLNTSHPLADLTGATNVKLVPVSTSSNALDKLLKPDFSSLGPEYQSLPPNILMNNAKQANDIEKDLLNDSLKQKTESQTIHDLVKTTVTSLIETTVKTSIEEMTKEVQQEKEKNLAAKLMPSLFPASNTVSSSSPNPATSPFKFLQDGVKNDANVQKSPTQQAKMASTLSPNGSTIQEAVSLFNAEQSKLNDSVIEKLAKLNHKEHEKEDPVLSASSSSMNVKDSSSNNKLTPGMTPSNSQIINPLISQSTSTHSMTVPASSQEFCMNLNMNLVAAAANSTKVPVVADGVATAEHQRFTSNASTSSIHNDLKMILEGNSTSPSQQKEGDKKDDGQKESPKPQREKLNRSKNSKPKSEKSEKVEKSEKSNDEMNKLVTLMKQMAENKGKPGMQIGSDESGRYRYTKEFLQQIRTERSGFIENISPEIFKAYCYCMSGKYWDPEKYFDIVQYSGDYERVVQQQQNQQQNAKNMTNNNNNSKKNVKNDKKTKVVKNVKSVQNDANNNIKENIMSLMKMNSGKQADKVLLDMLKKNQEPKLKEEPKQVNLMDMLNKKPKNANILGELFNQNQSSQTGPKHRPVILTAQELELSQINRPVNRLFTALNQTPDKVKSPNSCGNSCGSECSSASSESAKNTTEAYKQLIKNLNNHPLCTPSTARASSLDNVLSKLQHKKNDSETQHNVAKDGTNLLKHLLHLKPEHGDEQEKKLKHKRNHHNQRHQKSSKPDDKQVITSVESTVTTTTTTTITQTQFPLVNPHEKPFQNLKTTNNEKPVNQLENLFSKMKVQKNDKPVEKKTEKDHFNSLLNKIMPVSNNVVEACTKPKQQQQQVKQEQENILKWFGGLNSVQQQQQTKPNFCARTLTEIELMSGHFP